MAYMSQDHKKTLVPAIKAVLAKYGVKGTVAVRHHSTLVVNVSQGRLDLIGNANAKSQERSPAGERRAPWKDHIDVNNYHVWDQFSGDCLEFVLALLDACNAGNWDKSDLCADYHNVGWYVDINLGRYNRPYIFVANSQNPDAASATTGASVSVSERDYGGAFDGFTVSSDADSGL
jgi:hypothetical protein